MEKQKFGKKDIFSPLLKTKRENIKKADELLELSVNSKKLESKNEDVIFKELMPTEIKSSNMIIHSFRIREDLVEGLRECAFFEKTKIYKVINYALERFLKDYKSKKNAQAS